MNSPDPLPFTFGRSDLPAFRRSAFLRPFLSTFQLSHVFNLQLLLTPSFHRPYPDPADLSAELTAGLADFKSAEAVNQFLSRLLILQAQGRIAPRPAAVMIFNCNQLLHFLGFIVREKAVEPTQIVLDIPCAVGTRAQAQP